MNDDKLRLEHILEAISKIEEFTSESSLNNFKNDEKTVSAVLYQLTIIGEAAVALSDEFREKHADLPLHEITGMRNHLIHGYFKVRLETVWKTCTEDIPALKKSLEA